MIYNRFDPNFTITELGVWIDYPAPMLRVYPKFILMGTLTTLAVYRVKRPEKATI